MFKKKTEKLDYFDEFIKLAEWGVQSAEFLKQVLADYPVADLSQKLDEMHEIEHNADLAKYRLMRYMYNDLLPPFDRQDVIALVTSLDHAIDMIEDVMITLKSINHKTLLRKSTDFWIWSKNQPKNCL